MYKNAGKLKLRFISTKGELTVEQLWNLSLKDLDNLAIALEQEHEESGKKSFLAVQSQKDKVAKLKFDIVLDILKTKVEENEAARNIKSNKEHNAKIDALIAEKQDESLKGKTIEELEALRKE
jgi:hypothetical protein